MILGIMRVSMEVVVPTNLTRAAEVRIIAGIGDVRLNIPIGADVLIHLTGGVRMTLLTSTSPVTSVIRITILSAETGSVETLPVNRATTATALIMKTVNILSRGGRLEMV